MFHGISAIISGFWGLGIRLTTDHLESTGNFHSQTATADIIDASMKWFVKAKKLQTWINMVHWTTLTFCYDSLLNDSFFCIISRHFSKTSWQIPALSGTRIPAMIQTPLIPETSWDPVSEKRPKIYGRFESKEKWWFTIANLRYPAKKNK